MRQETAFNRIWRITLAVYARYMDQKESPDDDPGDVEGYGWGV